MGQGCEIAASNAVTFIILHMAVWMQDEWLI